MTKKNIKSFAARLLSCFTMSCLLISSASAYTPTCSSMSYPTDGPKCHRNTTDGGWYHTFGDGTLNGGVGDYGYDDRYFWVSGFNSTYTKYARDAVSMWVYTTSSVGVTTPISIVETSTKSEAVFEFVSSSDLPSGTVGYCEYHKSNNIIEPDSNGVLANYGWARVYISTGNMVDLSMTTAQRKATFAHELGHAMGLAHMTCDPTSIMHQAVDTWGNERTATEPSEVDCHTINHLYE